MKIDKYLIADKIGKNEIEGTLELIRLNIDEDTRLDDYRNRLTLIKNKYRELELQSNAGLIDKETELIFRNRLTWELLQFINNLPETILEGDIPKYIHEKYEEPRLIDRFFSTVIDLIVISALVVPVFVIFISIVNHHFLSIKGSIVLALLITFFQSKDMLYGRSIGKRVMKLGVKNIGTGKAANEISCILRNLTVIIFPAEILFFVISFFLPSRRLGDFIADTIVIKTPNSLTLISSVKFDIRRYRFTKEMWIAILIGLASTILNFIAVYYITVFELDFWKNYMN